MGSVAPAPQLCEPSGVCPPADVGSRAEGVPAAREATQRMMLMPALWNVADVRLRGNAQPFTPVCSSSAVKIRSSERALLNSCVCVNLGHRVS